MRTVAIGDGAGRMRYVKETAVRRIRNGGKKGMDLKLRAEKFGMMSRWIWSGERMYSEC